MPGAKVWDPTPAGGSLSTARGEQNPSADGASLSSTEVALTRALVSDAGKSPRIIKQFSDLLGVTFATSNATYVATIDPASPFGCPALKVVCTWSTTGGRVEITPPALGIPKFNGHVGYTIWIDDATKVGQVGTFLGTTAFANSTQFDDKIFAGSDQCVSGPRITWVGPMKQASSQALSADSFVYGTDTLATTKLRIAACNPLVTGGTATVWIKDCWIAKPQRPVCVFSFDDGYDAWASTVLPALARYGYKGTFGIDAEKIDGVGGITSANMAAVVAAGHHIASHNQFNYRLQILIGQGSGEQNGSGPSQDVTAYAAAYHGGRATYEALGADPDGFVYHPWVQGGPDRAGVDALAGAGVDIARGTSPYEPMMYGAPCLYDSAMNMRSIALNPSYTLAQVQAKVLSAYQNGGIAFIMGHNFVASGPAGVEWLSSDFYSLVDYVQSLGIEVITAKQLRDRLAATGLIQDRRDQRLANTQQPIRMIGRLLAANMNSTADQSIPLMAGTWKVESIYFTKPSVTLSGSAAAGGVYSATAKGGTAIVAAAQSYGSGLVATTDVLGPPTAATATITSATGTTPVYLSLTTAHGSAATADVFVFGRPA